MKFAAPCLLVITSFLCGAIAASPPPISRSAVPPPNPESKIPPPAYALDSRVIGNAESLFRPNTDLQAPGMNMYRVSPTEHWPTIFSIEGMDRWRFIDPTDMAATEAFVIGAYGAPEASDYAQRVSDAGSNWLRRLLRADSSIGDEDRGLPQATDSAALRMPAVPYWYLPCNARACGR